MLIFSILAWCFLFWYSHNHPIKGIPFKLRGGGGDDDEERRQQYEQATAPNREYQASLNKIFESIYKPYTQDVYGLWGEQVKPAFQTMLPKLLQEAQDPWLNLEPIFSNIWQRTREKTAAEWKPIEERTSQRLAGAGALGTGAALKAGTDIEFGKYKSLETQAIDQALQEFTMQTQAKQQSYANLFGALNQVPQVGSTFGAAKYFEPEMIPPYIEQDKGWSWSGMGQGALAGASTGATVGGPWGAVIGAVAGAGLGGASGYGGQGNQDMSALFDLFKKSQQAKPAKPLLVTV